MQLLHQTFTALTYVIARSLASFAGREPSESREQPGQRDRGAVSLEQVLWFVAAGVSVAVIAGILWSQIRGQAASPISTPSAP